MTERTEIVNAAGMTRSQVHARLGTPWVTDMARRVDLFRLAGKQRTLLVVLAPYPVPLPNFSRHYVGYTLVSYAEDDRVDGADSAFVIDAVQQSYPPDPAHKPVARAGDYAVVHPVGGKDSVALSVSIDRFLKDRPATARKDVCTVLVGCADEPAASGRDAVCWPTVRIDDADRRELMLSASWFLPPPSPAAASAPHDQAISCIGAVCTAKQSLLVPLELTPGKHRLQLSNRFFEGRVDGKISCQAGELVFATEHGEKTAAYSLSQQLGHGLNVGKAQGRIEFTSEPPPALSQSRVLINQGGQWLVGANPAAVPAPGLPR